MEYNSIMAFIACLFFLFIFGKIFIVPLKIILRFMLNSLLGGVIVYIINIMGELINFHIGLNIITSIIVGLLGIPGAILIIAVKLLVIG